MTLEQIFYRFCKDENVYNDVVKAINHECEYINRYYKMTRRNIATPRKVLNDRIKNYGYRDFIAPLMGYTWSASQFYKHYPKFKSVCRKWRYFVDHNIILDKNTLKDGDKVSCLYLGRDRDIEFNALILTPFRVKNNSPHSDSFNCIFSILSIKKINDKPAQIGWLIKKNKKIYGATQRN